MTTRTSDPSAWPTSGMPLARSHRGLDLKGLQESRTSSDEEKSFVRSGRAPSEAGWLPYGFDREPSLVMAEWFRPSVSVHTWT